MEQQIRLINTDAQELLSIITAGNCLIVNHCDNDGFVSGAIMRHLCGDLTQCIPMAYQPFDINIDPYVDTLIFVDYSLKLDVLNKFKSENPNIKNVVIIDHHESAYREYKNVDFSKENIYGMILYSPKGSVALCGAELVWEYYTAIYAESFVPSINRIVKLVGDWDVWRWEPVNDQEPVNFGSGSRHIKLSSVDAWSEFLNLDNIADPERNNRTDSCITTGRIITEYLEVMSLGIMRNAYECTLDGYSCLAVNSSLRSSLVFGDKIHDYDVVAAYGYNGKTNVVSLFSKKLNCSLIAANHGGGGHEGAAGFSAVELPFVR